MTRRIRFRASAAEQRRAVQAGLNLYSAKPVDIGAAPKRVPVPRPKKRPSEDRTEAPVLRAVGELLACHPKVAIAIRINSGMAYSESGAPVWFHRLIGPGRISDYIGTLRDGRSFALECKPPDWVAGKASGKGREREAEQEAYIDRVIEAGGVGGFVRSVDEAMAVLR